MPSYEFDRLEATSAASNQYTHAQNATTAPVRRGRRLLLGAGLAVGAVAALALKKTFTPCLVVIGVPTDEALVSLAEVQTQEISDLMKNHHDPNALHRYLAASAQAAEAVDSAQGSPAAQQAASAAKKAVAEAMAEKDPAKARELVSRAMDRAKAKWRGKREDLKSYLSSDRRGLRVHLPKPTHSPKEKASIAECVFNVDQAVTQIAALAANIADAAKTCVKGVQLNNTQGRTCIVNLAAIGYSVSTISGALSLAAENCATTLVANTDALCAGSISGLGAQVSQLAGAAALTNEMCDPIGKDAIPPGEIPSHLGQPEIKRRLTEHNATAGAAEARRLLFGGGYGADATQCSVDVVSISWWLAQAGIAINAAANKNAGASCPKTTLPPIYEKSKEAKNYIMAACSIDIAGAIFAFGQVIQYLQFAVSHCADQLNVNGLCGAGIDGMVSSLAGMFSSGPAFWISCMNLNLLKGSKRRKAELNMAEIASKITHTQKYNKVSLSALNQAGNFGRRVSDEETADLSGEDAIEEMKTRFATPEDAWKSIGYDFDDANAEWRKSRPKLRPEELVSLLEEPPASTEQKVSAQATGGGLLGGMQMCTPQA